MCGIAGILFKQQEGPIGDLLIKMLADLNRRGPDSTGLAIYGNLPKGNLIMRIKVDEDAKQETIDWEELIVETAREFGSVKESHRAGYYVRVVMDYDGPYEELAAAIEASSQGVEVFSMGQHLEIIKQMGSAERLNATYNISALRDTRYFPHANGDRKPCRYQSRAPVLGSSVPGYNCRS